MQSTHRPGLRIDGLEYSIWDRDRFLEWRQGELDAVHVTVSIWESARATLRAIGEWKRLAHENADLISIARDTSDILEAQIQSRTAVIIGLQNTTSFEDDLDLMWGFHEAGVRIAQLTYNIQNSVGSGCWENEDRGISGHYGRHLIREMNQAGMVIDVSHCGEQTCWDAIELSEAPVAITHGNPREFVGDGVELAMRNRSTDLIKGLADSGGLIGLSMYPRIAPGGNDCTLDLFCDMVAWTAEQIGVEHIGIGTDLYLGHGPEQAHWWRCGRWARQPAIPISGLPQFPDWMQTPAQFGSIDVGLERKGFSPEERDMIMGGNYFSYLDRVFTSNTHNG